MDRHYGANFGIPGPSNHINAAATLPPYVGPPRGLSFSHSAGVYGHSLGGGGGGAGRGEASPAAARQCSYPAPNVNVPFQSNTLPANFPGFEESGGIAGMFPGFNPPNLDTFEEEMVADWSEDQKKEREVILSNRVKLTQYIHDVTVLFPNMKQDGIFTNDDCHLINHEITGTMKVDRFIDILLTKGPKAIGNFHSALETEYPALFEVLSRLFVNAGVTLPPERELREDSEEDSGNVSTSSSGHSDGVPPRGRSVYRCGIKTIRKHFFELQRHCDEVQNQKDELQKSLIQREKEINSLLSHRDQVLNQKYEEFIRLMANWRELITIQSDDRLQKMQQLLSEREDIQSEYEQLEQEYMLVVSELNAARDRISKLLNHLERTNKEAGLTQEQLLDKISQLEGEIAQKEGTIQRMNRRMDRVGCKDISSSIVSEIDAGDDSSSEVAMLQERLKTVEEERDSFEQRMKVALKERQGTLDENERLVSKCHSERERRRKAEKSLQRLLNPQYPGDTTSMHSGTEGATNEVEPLEEVTIVMPAEDMGLTLDTCVVVKELTDSGNANKSGVKLGDHLQQVNRIKISTDKDNPLGFAKKLLESAAQTVTLSLLRPSAAMPPGNNGGLPLTPGLANTPISPLPGTWSMSINPLEHEFDRRLQYRKISADGNMPLSLPISRPAYYKHTSAGKASRSTSASAVDTSDKDSDDSLSLVSPGDGRNDSDIIDHRISLASSHDFGAGIVTSPRASKAENYPGYDGEEFDNEDINILADNGEIPATGILTASTSESKLLTTSLVTDHVLDGDMNQSSPLHRRKIVKKEKRKRVVSKSLENIYKVGGGSEVILTPFTPGGNKGGARQVLLPSGQLGTGLRILGGRGNGFFIQSDRQSNRSLQSGDEILAIGNRELDKMNYAEVKELLASFKEKGKCIIQVKSNLQGYTRLLANESSRRDNFYVRSKMSYQRPTVRGGGNQLLSYEKGDIFYVFDTLPLDHVGMWNVKKINSRGEGIETGLIPVEVSPSETGEGASTLPTWIAKNYSPRTKPKSPHSLPPLLDKQRSIPAAIHAYKYYEPIKIVKMTEPRPVVLLGAHEAEIRRYLVEHGSNSDIKFAYCRKEPTENLADVSDDQIVETIETSDGPVASTVEHVHEIAKDGFHCVLCLRAEDLTRPGVASLTPIVLLLNPKRGFKIKLHHTGPFGQVGNNQPAVFQPEQIREIGRKYKLYITGELELSSTMHVTEITHEVRDKVASQQKSVIWEFDS